MQVPASTYNPHSHYQNSGVDAHKSNAGFLATTPDGPADSAQARPNITSLLVSDAVNGTLLRLQETGSVFDADDTDLMNVRGVSDQDRQRFTEIIQEAADTGAYNNPVDYIHSLSSSDIQVLRRVHSLGDASSVLNTDAEGAINLLLPPENHVDINNDAIVKTGAAAGFVFPPPNSPQSVKDAWEELTKDMTLREKMMAPTMFMVASVAANIKFDDDGTPVGIYEPSDPEYQNIFGTSDGEWETLLSELIAQSRELEKMDPKYRERTEFLTKFAEHLSGTGKTTAQVSL